MVYLPHFPLSSKAAISFNSAEKLLNILPNLNNPQNKMPPIIHIAGTNGKGSVAAFLASIFQAQNYKTHIYTSPHLHHCNERIVVANHQIDDGYLYQALEEVRIASQNIALTLFEGLTLAAMLVFAQNEADICIIETGMGGRVDATNIMENKIATILTSISLDHQEFLGDNLLAIACEKAYIMKKAVPCINAPQSQLAQMAIAVRAKEIGALLLNCNQDFKVAVNSNQTFDFSYFGRNYCPEFKNLNQPVLPGWHQYLNCSLAIAAICAIEDNKNNFSHNLEGFKISQDSINQGLLKVKWPSRLEKLSHKLLSKDDQLWIDGAHNVGGFEIVADWLKEQIMADEASLQPKRNYLIVGFSKNKAKSEFFSFFKDIIDCICAIRVKGEPNPEEAEVIVDQILQAGINQVLVKEDLPTAIDFLKNLDHNNPCRIVVCGSLYLARDLKFSS